MRAPIFLSLLAAVVASTACGNPARDELLRTHAAPDDAYRVLYQDPPWTVTETDDDYVRLEVEANGTRFGDIDAMVIPPKFLCEASTSEGRSVDLIRQDERRAERAGDDIIRASTEVSTDQGAEGWELVTSRLTSDGSRFSRVVYLDRTRGRGVVRLYFEANSDPRDAEVDAMIADFLVDPE